MQPNRMVSLHTSLVGFDARQSRQIRMTAGFGITKPNLMPRSLRHRPEAVILQRSQDLAAHAIVSARLIHSCMRIRGRPPRLANSRIAQSRCIKRHRRTMTRQRRRVRQTAAQRMTDHRHVIRTKLLLCDFAQPYSITVGARRKTDGLVSVCSPVLPAGWFCSAKRDDIMTLPVGVDCRFEVRL